MTKYIVEHEGSEHFTDTYENILKKAHELAEYFEGEVIEQTIEWSYGELGRNGKTYVEAILLDDQLFAVEAESEFPSDVLLFDSSAGNLNIYAAYGYKSKAEYLAKKLELNDQRGNPSISALFRYLIDNELKKLDDQKA